MPVRRSVAPRVEPLEPREVPAVGIPTVREGAAATPAGLTAVRDSFLTDLGSPNRTLTWDDVPTAQADPNPLPGNFYLAQGVQLTTPGSGLRVSGDPAVVGTANARFGTIDPTYPTTAFTQAFSNPRLFTPVGATTTDVTFVVPGTNTPATVRGFGAVFADVDTAAGARLEFYDRDGNLLLSRNVAALPGNGNLSFLGVSYRDPIVATVRIISGTAPLAQGVADVTQGGTADLVVLDDFVYAEPTDRPPLGPAAPSRDFAAGVGGSAAPLVKVYNPNGTERFGFTAFTPAFTGGVRTAVADITGDGIADIVVGTGPGVSTQVRVIDGSNGKEVLNYAPFEASFTGGVFVAAGDLNRDGRAEVVITPDEGGGPRVIVLNGNGFNVLADFFGIEDPAFRGGARPAVGDMTGDGVADLVVAAGFGGGPRVAFFDGPSVAAGSPVKLFNDIFVFEASLRDGVYAAVGDVNGDGFGDLIAGGGPQGGPRVLVLSGRVLLNAGTFIPNPPTPADAVLASFFVGDPASRGGIRVAAKDLNGDEFADLVTGAGEGAGTAVRAYLGQNLVPGGQPPEFFGFEAFPGATDGVFVG